MKILDKVFMFLIMLGFTIILPFFYIGFILKWAYVDAKISSKLFFINIKVLYIKAYKELRK